MLRLFQEEADKVAADEAGTASNEDFHLKIGDAELALFLNGWFTGFLVDRLFG